MIVAVDDGDNEDGHDGEVVGVGLVLYVSAFPPETRYEEHVLGQLRRSMALASLTHSLCGREPAKARPLLRTLSLAHPPSPPRTRKRKKPCAPLSAGSDDEQFSWLFRFHLVFYFLHVAASKAN